MEIDRRRVAILAAIWLLPSAVLLGVTWAVHARYAIDVPPRLGPEARAAALAPIRDALDKKGSTVVPDHPELARALPGDGPVVIGVWLDGSMKARLTVPAATVAEAVGKAAGVLDKHPNISGLTPGERRAARIKIDVVVGRAPLLEKGDFLADATGGILSALGMHPGTDGIGVTLNGSEDVVLLPDELMRGRILMADQPLEFVPEFKVGLDFEIADKTLQGISGKQQIYGAADKSYWRFRADAFVERPAGERDGPPIRLTRNMPPRPELTADNLREAAILGGRYLVDHLADNGRYIYEQDLSTGSGTNPNTPGPYSIPRHAGTTYFLAELFRITGEEFLREPIERAFAHLQELIEKGGCTGETPDGARFECVIDHNPRLNKRIEALQALYDQTPPGPRRDQVEEKLRRQQGYKTAGLGSTALTVVALAEYKRATGSDTYMPMTRALAEWLLVMQRPDGSFRHLYVVPRDEPVEDVTLLYFSGEAALALARMHLITGEERYKVAAEKALDHLVGWYDFFVGGFMYGEEHWTCIAAEAAWPALKKPRYEEFCDGYAAFLRDQQFGPGDFPGQADLVGAYGVSPFVMPHNTPAGSRTEAMISSYLLGKYHGDPDPEIRGQILAAMHYVLGQQITPASAWDVSPKAHGIGAIPGSPIDRVVRIDYVQHVCSALIRSIEVLESPGG